MPQVELNDPRFLSYMKSVDEELIADTINEKYLSAEDKQAFSEAKDKAWQVWIDNQAWRAVGRSKLKKVNLCRHACFKDGSPPRKARLQTAESSSKACAIVMSWKVNWIRKV